ncbi:hypothetical protein G6F55_012170 [Rhizopus delemar]|nr:hypothetical protein G6F55_012170 [Rhizopus delemar]
MGYEFLIAAQYINKDHWQGGWPNQLTLLPLQYTSYSSLVQRPRLTTTFWEDESTLCYQVDTQGVCVARRQDNNMINGTKLLNVAGLSRGKRDGILKNEKDRVVAKVGAMHLKGVWIPLARAKTLANQFNISDALYPIFEDNPSSFLCPSQCRQLQDVPIAYRTESFTEVDPSFSIQQSYTGLF